MMLNSVKHSGPLSILGTLVAMLLMPSSIFNCNSACADDTAPGNSKGSLRVGVSEADITPPVGFPMAGYYHERLAEGEIDPLKARAIVFRDDHTSAALVVCDLIGISTDLKNEVRRRASEKTGIPESHIAISATHSHTAPDYMKELYLKLGNEPQESLRAEYIDRLIDGPVEAICQADAAAGQATIESGTASQNVRDEAGNPRGILSNFALHLDTVGGMKWSADYPFFIERTLQQATGASVVSIFGNGCCGDINHVNPRNADRNNAATIGQSIGDSIVRDLPSLQPLQQRTLSVKSRVLQLPLQDATEEEVKHSIELLAKAKRKEPVEFLEQVTAYKKLIIDQMRHQKPFAKTADHITWGLSRALAGIGETMPVDMTVITLGTDIAIVALPGEAFVELGLAIKQGSPFRTTMVIELSNCVETIYVPTRAAYAHGSYEVTNSTTMPGSGEMLVQAALELLKEAAGEATSAAPPTLKK